MNLSPLVACTSSPVKPARAVCRMSAGVAPLWRTLAAPDVKARPVNPAPAVQGRHRRRRSKRGPTALRLGVLAAAGASLLGCSILGVSPSLQTMRVEPVYHLGTQSADAAYAAGKSALGAGQFDLALLNFDRALSLQPGWADAENARVVALARAGRTAEALRLAQAAVAAGVASLEMRNNLLLLTQRQAGGVTAPNLNAVAATGSAAAAQAAPDSVSTQLRWAQHGANVLELQRLSPPQSVTDVAQSAPPTASELRAAVGGAKALRVEISNGAGRTGLAKSTAQALRASGVNTVQLTNHANYRVQQTEVQYRVADDASAARALAWSLSEALSVGVARNPALRQGMDLRLLLGQDAAELMLRQQRITRAISGDGTQQTARADARAPTMAALSAAPPTQAQVAQSLTAQGNISTR